MARRLTVIEARFPARTAFNSLLSSWRRDGLVVLLTSVWIGYDLLRTEVLDSVDITEADDDLERSITMLLEPRIRRNLESCPWEIQHGSYEQATRKPSPAQPPQYDLAFVLRANPRYMWPLEAKVVRTPTAVAPYVKELKANFLSGRYAPFSPSGAMLGYLVTGDESDAFSSIANAVPCELKPHPELATRPHRTSIHLRKKTRVRGARLICHHLMMKMT